MSHRMRAVAVLLAWLACSGGAWLIAERQAARLEAEAETAALGRADLAAEAIKQNVLRTLEAVESLHDLAQSRQRLLENGDASGAEAIEMQLALVARRGRFGVLQVGIIGRDGLLTWSSLPQWRPVNLNDREHFRIHRDGYQGLFVSAPLVGRASDQWSVQLTRPLHTREGAFAGVAVVSIDPLDLARDLSSLQFAPGSSAALLRKDGTFLARSSDMRRFLGLVLKPDAPLMMRLNASESGRLRIERSTFDQRPKLAGYRVLAEAPLAVAVILDARRELASTSFVRPAVRAAAGAISLLALALAALGLLWLERQRTQADLEMARREREAMLERLAQSQRMEALGRLAGGVAHDFNNVLQAVLGGAKTIQRRAEDTKAVQRMAGIVVEAAERGASVTRRLLAFARRGELRAEAVEVGALLASLREVLTYTLGANIKVQVEAPPTLPRLLADRGQLETVLVNLAINGRDAMAPLGGGTLTLSAAAEVVSPGGAGELGLAAGSYVRLAVTDTGTGMDAAVLARAAEPFFTTKPQGKGTGLGLAMAKGFAEQSGGAIRIRSQLGRGTAVLLWLPEAGEGAAAKPPPVPEPAETPLLRAGRVLLVDDEPQVRSVLSASLRDRGHAVEEAENGSAALAVLAAAPRFDVLVSDLAMPGMDGLELLRQARRRHPGLPALLITGYAGDLHGDGFVEAGGQGPLLLLRKPITPEELADRVAALLNARDAAPANPGST
ncbi:hybrid sensor histidine kinase/response regulator [Roseomonas sp. M0104]|uniref:histidine kinase n=1 Tax=Teichococcus coralli TaxID=2545983 RepID=A0A845BBC9_9PROT|nr:response regulator [Pseudoroseomonas coralli]MXP62677.1 hybrid sensor histidine kinase/response regulator [Pseudoroseomonas coralli]